MHTEQEISCRFAEYKFKLRALISEEMHLMMSFLRSYLAFP